MVASSVTSEELSSMTSSGAVVASDSGSDSGEATGEGESDIVRWIIGIQKQLFEFYKCNDIQSNMKYTLKL